MNNGDIQNIKLTKAYGIYFMADLQKAQAVNDRLKQINSTLGYIPERYRMNVYFSSIEEALKVSAYYNSKNNDRQYSIFETSFETLEKFKKLYENNKSMQRKYPVRYGMLTRYRIYNSAKEYLELQKNQSTNSTVENSL